MSKCKTEVAGPIEVKAMGICDLPNSLPSTIVDVKLDKLAELFACELDKINARLELYILAEQGRKGAKAGKRLRKDSEEEA